jgi:hemerythrin-like metal-binding protein
MPDPSFITGHEGIDAQHQRLFDACDRLKRLVFPGGDEPGTMSGVHRAIESGALTEPHVDTETKAVAAQLIQYAVEHFAYEDGLMEDARPKILAAYAAEYAKHVRLHHAEHNSFLKTSIVYSGMHETHPVSALSLYVFVRHWLVAHICRTDKDLVYWLGVVGGLSKDAPTT